jgi:hypothetical protein
MSAVSAQFARRRSWDRSKKTQIAGYMKCQGALSFADKIMEQVHIYEIA